MTHEKRTILLDASALRNSHCIRKLYLTIIQGYRSKLNSQSIEFGSAFHLCCKVTEETYGNIGAGVKAAKKYFSTRPMQLEKGKEHLDLDFLAICCMTWFDNYRGDDSFDLLLDVNDLGSWKGEQQSLLKFPKGKPLVEQKFAIPFYESDYVRILLTGTIDKIVFHRTSKLIALGDYKTTSYWKPNEFLSEFNLSGQLYFYTLVLKKIIEMCDNNSILAKWRNKEVGCFIDGVFLKKSKEDGGPTVEIKRSEVFIWTEKQLRDYKLMLMAACKDIDNLIADQLGGKWTGLPWPEGIINSTCYTKGPCNFASLCSFSDGVAQEHLLNLKFVKKPYDPLNF